MKKYSIYLTGEEGQILNLGKQKAIGYKDFVALKKKLAMLGKVLKNYTNEVTMTIYITHKGKVTKEIITL